MNQKRNLRPVSIILFILISVVSLIAHDHFQVPNPASQLHATSQPNTGPTTELSGAKCHVRGDLPDPVCTPGVTDPAVTEANVATTICVRGYTKTVRPPATYTDKLKRQQMQEYGFTDSSRLHEEDHLISLELGGSPSDPGNLWPEPGASPNKKDKIEDFLHTAICAGQISLADAQHRISTDWTTADAGLRH